MCGLNVKEMGYSVWTESCSRWGPVMVCHENGNDRWGLSEARSVCSLHQISNKFTGPCEEHEVCVCVCVCACVCVRARAEMRSRSPGRQLSGREAERRTFSARRRRIRSFSKAPTN